MDAPQGDRSLDLPDGPSVLWVVYLGSDLGEAMTRPKGKEPAKTRKLSGAAARSVNGERLGGRPKGSPNKATGNAREAIAAFVEGNAHRLQGWLDQIALEQGPEKAVRCFMDLLEYHVPKLARTELTGDGGGPVQSQIQIIIQPVKPRD